MSPYRSSVHTVPWVSVTDCRIRGAVTSRPRERQLIKRSIKTIRFFPLLVGVALKRSNPAQDEKRMSMCCAHPASVVCARGVLFFLLAKVISARCGARWHVLLGKLLLRPTIKNRGVTFGYVNYLTIKSTAGKGKYFPDRVLSTRQVTSQHTAVRDQTSFFFLSGIL